MNKQSLDSTEDFVKVTTAKHLVSDLNLTSI